MDRVSAETRSYIMSQIRSKDTVPETTVFRILNRLGVAYTRHAPSLPGKPDILIESAKLIIFVHGCFFHCHGPCFRMPKSNLAFWEPKLKRNVERDAEHTARLKEMGYRVLTIWECLTRKKRVASLEKELSGYLTKLGVLVAL
jgi:DNA mismatch endonuclease (patch repair protein)